MTIHDLPWTGEVAGTGFLIEVDFAAGAVSSFTLEPPPGDV